MTTILAKVDVPRRWHTKGMTWYSPASVRWTAASRRLIPVRLIGVAAGYVPLLIVAVVLAAAVSDVLWWTVIAVAVAMAWSAWVAVRLVLAHGWAERDDDLLVRRGRLVRRVTVIPYGRMQYVEVMAGPVARAFGLCSIRLHTASPGTDATLDGVPAAQGERLRDRLTERGEAQLVGL